MTPAVPKASSLTVRDRAMLGHRGLPGKRCRFCGWQHSIVVSVNNHHDPHRGVLPVSEQHRLPRFAAEGFGNCGRVFGLPGDVPCHALLHNNGGRLAILAPEAGGWFATCDERAAVAINVRRKLAGWVPVRPGIAFFIGYESDQSEG